MGKGSPPLQKKVENLSRGGPKTSEKPSVFERSTVYNFIFKFIFILYLINKYI